MAMVTEVYCLGSSERASGYGVLGRGGTATRAEMAEGCFVLWSVLGKGDEGVEDGLGAMGNGQGNAQHTSTGRKSLDRICWMAWDGIGWMDG